MNNRLLTPMMLVFSLLLVFSNILGIKPIVSHATQLEKAVTVSAFDEDGEDVIPLTAVEFEPGANGIDVLEDAAKASDVELVTEEHSEYGKMIKEIGDHKQDDSNYWSFNTQGKASNVGASSYEVKNGDNLTFVYGNNDETINVHVSAVNGNETLIEKTDVELTSNSTAYDALYQAAKDIELDVSVDDTYFTAINNLGKTDLTDTEFWSLSTNDMLAEVGAVQHMLSDGDHVQLEVDSFEAPEEDEHKEGTDKTDDPKEDPSKGDVSDKKDPTDKKVEATMVDKGNVTVKSEIEDIIKYAEKNMVWEYGSEWWVWSLAHTDLQVPDSYVKSVKDEVKEVKGEFRGLELQKVIISLSLLGEDVTEFAGYNLIDKLENKPKPAINDYIYSLLAIDSANYEASEGFRDDLIDKILAEEIDGGGWAFFGDTPSVDITAMVLASFAPYKDDPKVEAAIDQSLEYLSEAQDDNGGFYEEFNGGYSSESVSQLIAALSALDIDSKSDEFTKKDQNLLDYLAQFKQDDHGYSHIIDDEQSMPMSTQQALLGYVAYDKFAAENGSIYQQPVVEKEEDEDDEKEKKQTGDGNKPGDGTSGDIENPSKDKKDKDGKDDKKDKDDKEDKDKVILPGKTTDNGTPGKGSGNQLPKTASGMFNYLAIGLLFIVVGSIFLYIKRRKSTES